MPVRPAKLRLKVRNEIPFELGLLGHSDADVVLHAIGESILGALALGDLGTHFPDNDMKYKNIDSSILLSKIVDMMIENKYEISNYRKQSYRT